MDAKDIQSDNLGGVFENSFDGSIDEEPEVVEDEEAELMINEESESTAVHCGRSW
jgi:hypothetical protein